MGAFDGLKLYQSSKNTSPPNNDLVKSDPFYLLTYLTRGQSVWGLDDSETFEDKEKALNLFWQKMEECRFPSLVCVDEYRRRSDIARIVRNEDTISKFNKLYRDGIVR